MRNKAPCGMPGLRGTDHIGFTVPDLDQALDFFCRVIGCEKIYELGPFQSNGDWMESHLGVHPRAVMRRLALLRCGHGSNFEIFQYEAPDQIARQPRNSDIGGHHLAFYSDDFQASLEWLLSNGVRILGTPTLRDQGPSGGQTWVYFLAPWGMQMELVSFPDGKLYEATTERRLWHPGYPEA